ncbi:MAG: type I-E CRISPR-associated protein Cse2/CasB [Bradymonadaceae bacterium]
MNDPPLHDGPTGEAAELETRTPQQGLTDTVHSIARYMNRNEHEGGISTGDLAELRRINPDKPFTPALWKILLDEISDLDRLSARRQRRWAILLQAMATCVGLHESTIDFGTALAEASWSELRFVRLMEARGDNLDKQLRRLAQYLASKNQNANWADAAWMLFVQEGEHAENTRQRIAKSYYKRMYAKENEQAD